MRRVIAANIVLLLVIVCKFGFSDVADVRPALRTAPGATIAAPATADWIGDLIDVLGGGGDDDDDEDEGEEPTNPQDP